jgi:hypothetical protein
VVDVCAEQLLPRAAPVVPVGGDVLAIAGKAVAPLSEYTTLFAEIPSVSQPITVRSSPADGIEILPF